MTAVGGDELGSRDGVVDDPGACSATVTTAPDDIDDPLDLVSRGEGARIAVAGGALPDGGVPTPGGTTNGVPSGTCPDAGGATLEACCTRSAI